MAAKPTVSVFPIGFTKRTVDELKGRRKVASVEGVVHVRIDMELAGLAPDDSWSPEDSRRREFSRGPGSPRSRFAPWGRRYARFARYSTIGARGVLI